MSQATLVKRMAGQMAAMEQKIAVLNSQLATTRADLARLTRR